MTNKKYTYKIAPSLLASEFMNLGSECVNVLRAGADWLHFDVMDGHFVPNLSFGLPILQQLRNSLGKDVVIDAHLMISNPDVYVKRYVDAGANIVSFHPEASYHPHRVVETIKEAGAKAALAINPATPLDTVGELAQDLDMVLLMSVNPGFGGQSFIPSTLNKIKRLAKLRDDCNATFEIEVDGGIKGSNIAEIASHGANIFVAGSAIFKTKDYKQTIDHMREELASIHA